MKIGEYKVIDDYFPDWLIQHVSKEMELIPMKWDNTPRKDSFKDCRFLGNMILIEDYWQLPDTSSWFAEYLIKCIHHDICKEYGITNTVRILHNGQFALKDDSMNGINHRDSEYNNYLSLIYMGHGNSGDTVILDKDNNEHRVSFKEGRMVIFNAKTLHRGEAPTSGYRASWGLVFPLFDPKGVRLNDTMIDPNVKETASNSREMPTD